MNVTRRDIVRGVGSGGLAGLAGCFTSDTDGSIPNLGSNVVGWPMARGGPQNRSYIPVSSASSGVETAWEFTLSSDGTVETQPVVSTKRVLVTADRIYAIDRATGETAWEFSNDGESRSFQTPAIGGDVAHVAHQAGDRGMVTAIDPRAGSRGWSRETRETLWDPPTVHGGTLYLPCDPHYRGFGNDNYVTTLSAIDAEERTERWAFDVDNSAGGGFSTPATSETAVFASLDDTLYSVSKSTGQERWSTTVSRYEAPSVSGGRVYVPIRDGLKAIDAERGDEAWRERVQGVPAIAVGDDRVYLGHSAGVSSLDTETGDVKWEVDPATEVRPTVTRDSVYLADGASLYELSAEDGSVRWETDIGEDAVAQPVFDGERLYVTTARSVRCYELS